MRRARMPSAGSRLAEGGFALITGLLLLVVITIIAVSMFHGFGTEEQIAGNTREKQRALNAAISAQQYAEWWLQSGNAPAAGNCTAVVASNPGQVCTNPLTNFGQVPWNVGVTFTQFNQTLAGAGSGPSLNYYAAPVFYVTDLGNSVSAGGEVYQIDAYAFGSSASTVAVVESTYVIKQPAINPGI